MQQLAALSGGTNEGLRMYSLANPMHIIVESQRVCTPQAARTARAFAIPLGHVSAPARMSGRGEGKSGLQYTLTGNAADSPQWPYIPSGSSAQVQRMYLAGATERVVAYADSLCV